MKTIIFVGHLSSFGIAFFDAIIRQSLFDVKEVVLADAWRWSEFRCRLAGKAFEEPGRKQQRKHKEATIKIRKQLTSIKVTLIRDANREALISHLSSYDIMLTAAFPQLFSEAIANAPRLGSVNFHPSYLPRCRGAHPVYWAIASQEPYSGVSSHIITPRIDGGPLLTRVKINYDPETITYSELYQLSLEQLPLVIEQTYDAITGARQKPQPAEKQSYFRNDRMSDHLIHWQKDTTAVVSAKIRAGSAFTFTDSGRKVYLLPPATTHSIVSDYSDYPVGSIISFSPNECLIRGIDGIINARYQFVFNRLLLRKLMGGFRRLKLRSFCEYCLLKLRIVGFKQFKA